MPTRSELSEAWLVGRARELSAVAQNSELGTQLNAAQETDELLTEAQRRGEPWMVGEILRCAAVVRLVTPSIADDAEPLLEEMIAHTRRHGLLVLEADAHALSGRRALMADREDAALSSIAKALAMLDDEPAPDALLPRRQWDRLLVSALVDIGLVLTQLGVYDMADRELAKANQHIRHSGGPHDIAVHLINRVRLQLGWGLRLERVDKDEDAVDRFATASAIAVAVEGPWRESLFPRRTDLPAAAQVPVLGAAHALARPGLEHVDRLKELLDVSMYPPELIMTSIALARSLAEGDRHEEALSALTKVRMQLEHDTSEPSLRLCLVREFARLSGPDSRATNTALSEYANELENELWGLARTRESTLRTRLDHERLTRKHGAMAQQALQDPLTGLPNRRALDERMDTLFNAPGAYPLSIALIDLDGFKGVNDRYSHAEGDDVLRAVASTIRDALRGDDLVARYGGDEFVVLLPGAPISAAEAALNRAVDAVDRLPAHLSRGVTLSIGVVAVFPQESPGQALSRADSAMYCAKREGGNRVSGGPAEGPLDSYSHPGLLPPVAP